MSFKEKIENQPAAWLLGTLLAGFLAGISAYQAILEIAQLEVVSKSRLEELREDLKSIQTEGLAMGLKPDSAPASQATERGPVVTQSSPASVEVTALRFSTKVPFPDRFDQVVPGMRLSEARAALPDGTLDSSGYFVNIDTGPFASVAYRHSSLGGDPIIESVIFFFRDDSVRQVVLRASLEKFGEIPHESEILGSRLLWPDINGFQLVLEDDIYKIARSDMRQAPNAGGRADG